MSEDKLIVREAYRVIIAGGRGFDDYEVLRKTKSSLSSRHSGIITNTERPTGRSFKTKT